MKRKLLVLNLALAAATVWAVAQFREELFGIKARETAMLGKKVKAAPAPPYFPPAPAPPVTPSSYAEIAQKMLFDKSRNPTVVIEQPPPPPPKPIPPMPILHGIMNIGDGVTAVFSLKAGAPNIDVREGEMVGPFKMVSISSQELVFQWEDHTIRKRPEELQERKVVETADSRGATPAPSGAPAPAAPPPAAVVNSPQGPGVDVGRGVRACVPGDSNPPGAVVDGMKKVVSDTPFGQACRWEPVK